MSQNDEDGSNFEYDDYDFEDDGSHIESLNQGDFDIKIKCSVDNNKITDADGEVHMYDGFRRVKADNGKIVYDGEKQLDKNERYGRSSSSSISSNTLSSTSSRPVSQGLSPEKEKRKADTEAVAQAAQAAGFNPIKSTSSSSSPVAPLSPPPGPPQQTLTPLSSAPPPPSGPSPKEQTFLKKIATSGAVPIAGMDQTTINKNDQKDVEKSKEERKKFNQRSVAFRGEDTNAKEDENTDDDEDENNDDWVNKGGRRTRQNRKQRKSHKYLYRVKINPKSTRRYKKQNRTMRKRYY